MTAPAATRTRIFIIEDNPVDVDLLRMSFAQIGDWPIETIVAADGETAVQMLQQQSSDAPAVPDLVILDLNLPRRDGAEVLHFIRTTEGLADVTVAVLSSSPEDLIQRKLTAAGVTADGHFTKPFDYVQFLQLGQTLRSWYEIQRQQR